MTQVPLTKLADEPTTIYSEIEPAPVTDRELHGFLLLSGLAMRLLYRYETGHDELHFAEAPDGVRLALYRYLPRGGERRGTPVILCHGFTSSRFTGDLMGRGIARRLAEKGHDVWSLELRGSGRSLRKTDGPRISRQFNFDDHVTKDVPAAIDYVLKTAGSGRVAWVGHSMGGMLLYAYLALTGDERIARGWPSDRPALSKTRPRCIT